MEKLKKLEREYEKLKNDPQELQEKYKQPKKN